jgi:flagellar basal body-associated protein FliL
MPATAVAIWVLLVVVVGVAIAALGHIFGWWGGGGHAHPDENVERAVDGFFGTYNNLTQDNTIEDVGPGRLTVGPSRADVWMPRFRRRVLQQQQQNQQQQNQQQQNQQQQN